MILGRPTNLWLGLVTAALGFAQVLIITVVPGVDPVAVGTVLGSLGGLLGVMILLIANQAPSVLPGGEVTVVTPKGEDNRTVTVR